MPDPSARLTAEAVTLLLEMMDLEEPMLNGAVAELMPGPVAVLRAAGILVPHGHEAVSASLADHDDVPVTMIQTETSGCLGYFSPAVGLTAVPAERLNLNRVDMVRALSVVGADLDFPPARPPRSLVDGLLWELGGARLGKRAARVQTWFARRLWDPVVRRQVEAALRARPYPGDVVIICSSPTGRLLNVALPGAILVALKDATLSEDSLSVSAEVLGARITGTAFVAPRGPVDLSPDGTLLKIRGSELMTFKSEGHIAAMRKLVDAFYRGERVPIGELTLLGTLRRHFGGARWKVLQPYLKSAEGRWEFVL